MKSIAEYAYDAITALEWELPIQVRIDTGIGSDWQGQPWIIISEGTESITEYQFGVINKTTPLTIRCLAADRQKAVDYCRKAAAAVHAAIEALEGNREAGILAITYERSETKLIQGRAEFESLRTFNVMSVVNI